MQLDYYLVQQKALESKLMSYSYKTKKLVFTGNTHHLIEFLILINKDNHERSDIGKN